MNLGVATGRLSLGGHHLADEAGHLVLLFDRAGLRGHVQAVEQIDGTGQRLGHRPQVALSLPVMQATGILAELPLTSDYKVQIRLVNGTDAYVPAVSA